MDAYRNLRDVIVDLSGLIADPGLIDDDGIERLSRAGSFNEIDSEMQLFWLLMV